MGQVGFQFDLRNAPNLLVAPTPKTTAITCLSCQLHRLISYVARHVMKCVAVIEKVNYLKNCVCFYLCIQLFQEKLLEKVHATIPKGIVGGFQFTGFQRNFKEWQERPWTYVCEC